MAPTWLPWSRGATVHANDWRKIPITLIKRANRVKRLTFIAEPRDCFNPKGEWVVMAHNLDDTGDVEQVGSPFHSRTEAEAEVARLEGSTQV